VDVGHGRKVPKSKFQVPKNTEASVRAEAHWNLRVEVSLDFGVWNLEFQ
jgi:hypothetical protein